MLWTQRRGERSSGGDISRQVHWILKQGKDFNQEKLHG